VNRPIANLNTVMTAIVRFEPYADHLLFVLTDAEARDGVFDGDTWKKSVDQWRLAVEPHALVICTARSTSYR